MSLVILCILISVAVNATEIIPVLKSLFVRVFRSYRPMSSVFDDDYIDLNGYFVFRFGRIPSIASVYQIEVTQALRHIETTYGQYIRKIYQSTYVEPENNELVFSRTLMVLDDRMMIELEYNNINIAYAPRRLEFAKQILMEMTAFRTKAKEEDFEISIIRMSANGLVLKRLDITPTQLDLSLYYNDDFLEVDNVIRDRLSRENDKGIVLLHGLPGTGKTTYLRYLVGKLKKRVLFVSSSVADNLMNPEFMDLLIDNPNCVLVIEDAENVLMDRKINRSSSVSNLLNLSDGLVSDCVSVQIICTFNSSLDQIDSALQRKGRLIARYGFGKLTVAKSRALSAHLGFDTSIDAPMTLAEIANQSELSFEPAKTEVLGFRSHLAGMN